MFPPTKKKNKYHEKITRQKLLVQLLFWLQSIRSQIVLITGPYAFTYYYAYFPTAYRSAMIYKSPKVLLRWLLKNTDMKYICLSFPRFAWVGPHPPPVPTPLGLPKQSISPTLPYVSPSKFGPDKNPITIKQVIIFMPHFMSQLTLRHSLLLCGSFNNNWASKQSTP